ncbi:hypothetical protein, partial [Methylobacterium sp. J-092]|uniref:hypothetical protein n=1 Tax=Methylobacterium sp. J-092 TaxID=2836667 RepID=UPI001FB9D665
MRELLLLPPQHWEGLTRLDLRRDRRHHAGEGRNGALKTSISIRLLSRVVSEQVCLIDLLTLVITNWRQLDGWEQLSQSLSYAVENRIGVWARQGYAVIPMS